MEDTPDNQQKVQQLNLGQVAQNFMDGLQRHADMLAFNLASREAVEEPAYKRRSSAPQIMPSGNRHQNFEQMQAYARDLMVRQVISDSLGLTVSALNNSHFFFALIKESNAAKKVDAKAHKRAETRHNDFLKLALVDKFKFLENEYSLKTGYESSILSLTIALQTLVENGGILKSEHLGDQPSLQIIIKRLEVGDAKSATGKSLARVVDEKKEFRSGEAIVFSDTEVQRILITVASFADALFKSVAHYARQIKGEA